MSLSRPVKFPLLKLPWLCIKCVLHNSDLFDIIYFATISNRARRIVRSSNYPLKDIDIHPNGAKEIRMGNQIYWQFTSNMYGDGVPLVLQRDSPPLRTRERYSWICPYLQSCTTGNEVDALKMGIEFMIDVFGCAIETVFFSGNELSDLLRLGISSVRKLYINRAERVNIQDLKYLLETIKVTDTYTFYVQIPANFFCEPKIFDCRRLSFLHENAADWVTLDILCQFNVPQLTFFSHRFSVEDIVLYITHWFNSEDQKLEYAIFNFKNSVSLKHSEIQHLNPLPFCEKRRNRYPFVEGWENTDISSGKDILRQDGLLATFFVKSTSVLFCIWHKRFPDAV
ncbi:unnamed protein product [Caenorhabditis brenneri]